MNKNPKPYEFDWDGACIPKTPHTYVYQKTFSIGIFQWVPKKNGKGLKKSRSYRRIKGLSAKPQEAIEKAKQVCQELNELFKGKPYFED